VHQVGFHYTDISLKLLKWFTCNISVVCRTYFK